MAQGAGVRPWMRGNEAARAASTAVIPNGDLIATDEGNIYIGDGTTQARNLAARASNPAATRNPLTGYWHADGYGAKGDGATADQVSIQAAIDACAAAGGGSVYVKPTSTFYSIASALTPKANVTVLSHGARVRCTGDFNAFYGSTIDCSNFVLDGLVFEGAVTEAPTSPKRERTHGSGMVSALYLLGSLDPSAAGAAPITNVTVRNCVFRNCYGLPLLIKGVRGSIRVHDNEFWNNRDIGFTHVGSVMFSDNYVNGSCDNGVSLSRVSSMMTCTGNIIVNCAYNGIWAAGFLTDPGPTNFSIAGNTVKDVGHSGIWLDQAPKYGAVVGNSIDCGYFRGPSDEPGDSNCNGIFIGGLGSNRAAPTDYATDLVISSNQIRRAANVGILVAGALRRSLIVGNLITDVGTQLLVDGTTAVSAADEQRNIGILVNQTATCADITIAMNRVTDSRATPYTNHAIRPSQSGAINQYMNDMSGCRNPFNLTEFGSLRNIAWTAVFGANTKHTLGATAGSNSGTGTIAGFDTNGAAGSARYNNFQTAGVLRWRSGVTGHAESSTQTGSNFAIGRYTNAGAYIDDPILIDRTTGQVRALSAPIQVFSATTANRPTAAVAGVGGLMFDATLGKPIWSDGTNWKDSTGATA